MSECVEHRVNKSTGHKAKTVIFDLLFFKVDRIKLMVLIIFGRFLTFKPKVAFDSQLAYFPSFLIDFLAVAHHIQAFEVPR